MFMLADGVEIVKIRWRLSSVWTRRYAIVIARRMAMASLS
jgi:hypothetical protein